MSGTANILVLATGGTIAGIAADPTAAGYVAGGVAIETLLGAADIGLDVRLRWQQVAAIGSQDMDAAIWSALVRSIEQAFAGEGCERIDGIVITHGTDTLEETAFVLDLVLPRGRPVVLVGAMRPANAIGADGPRNLANALRVASDPAAHGRGALVVIGDAVYPARSVRKARTTGTDAFRAFPGGPVAAVTPSSLAFFAPAAPVERIVYRLPPAGEIPPVAILYGHADMDVAIVSAILAVEGLQGIILAGVGAGNAPKAVLGLLAAAAAARGVAVVRSTRIEEGEVAGNLEIDDDRSGFIAGRSLSPHKCRLLLQLLLANQVDPSLRQQAFDTSG